MQSRTAALFLLIRAATGSPFSSASPCAQQAVLGTGSTVRSQSFAVLHACSSNVNTNYRRYTFKPAREAATKLIWLVLRNVQTRWKKFADFMAGCQVITTASHTKFLTTPEPPIGRDSLINHHLDLASDGDIGGDATRFAATLFDHLDYALGALGHIIRNHHLGAPFCEQDGSGANDARPPAVTNATFPLVFQLHLFRLLS